MPASQPAPTNGVTCGLLLCLTIYPGSLLTKRHHIGQMLDSYTVTSSIQKTAGTLQTASIPLYSLPMHITFANAFLCTPSAAHSYHRIYISSSLTNPDRSTQEAGIVQKQVGKPVPQKGAQPAALPSKGQRSGCVRMGREKAMSALHLQEEAVACKQLVSSRHGHSS